MNMTRRSFMKVSAIAIGSAVAVDVLGVDKLNVTHNLDAGLEGELHVVRGETIIGRNGNLVLARGNSSVVLKDGESIIFISYGNRLYEIGRGQ